MYIYVVNVPHVLGRFSCTCSMTIFPVPSFGDLPWPLAHPASSNHNQWWAGSGHETRGYEDNSDHRVTRCFGILAIRDPSNLIG